MKLHIKKDSANIEIWNVSIAYTVCHYISHAREEGNNQLKGIKDKTIVFLSIRLYRFWETVLL